MISIIIVGRNDNYGGDFYQRLDSTVRYNLSALEQRGIDAELVFVEWNPLLDHVTLSEHVASSFTSVRCFIVDPAIHTLVSKNRHIALFEYHAKNVGARRARGDWLLIMNPDNFLGHDVIDFLSRGDFDTETLYRARRIDIDSAQEVDRPARTDDYRDDPPPFCAASGDFIFCSKASFDRIGGFREDLTFTNTHKDSIFCTHFYETTGKARIIGHTYHLKHKLDLKWIRRIDYAWQHVNRRPQRSYGLERSCVEDVVAPRITMLTPPAGLQRRAGTTVVPEPYVPKRYRFGYRRSAVSGAIEAVRRGINLTFDRLLQRI